MLGMMAVQQGQEFLRNYIFKNRKEKMDCFVSVAQFSDFQFLLQQMFHIQDQPVRKSVSDGVYFSKVTSLHCTDCNSTEDRLCHISFWSMFRRLIVLKKNVLRKKSVVYQRLNEVAILPKRELTLDLVEKALKIMMNLHEDLLGTKLFR